ncbi:hypothetical protein QAD02_022731 [Eretmocerus hayati]|uniref:Uncharacterized protein n=1 Tax=Eretmocerus hayati TaxID=131215 RepID=A0ACC2PX52_9HYME|nr:hypothetical protein QAD02_022731 [Eretmocerus hayati]
MLYLEDYVEMIEHLPQELRDRFTELREMDLGVQNSVDSIEKKVKIFFSNAKKMKPNEKEAEYESIRKEYYKTLEDADEKVHLANQMYDLVERYLRRLDQELQKFKTELEADNRGITDILEKRSLELDQPPTNSSQKENRYNLTSSSSSSRSRDSHSHSRGEKRRDSNASSTSMDKRVALEKMPSTNSLPEARPSSANSGSLMQQSASMPSMAASPSPSMANSVGPVSYNLGHIGAGGNAIAAAASQAIAATQHMQHGRRTASLKASYDAINTGGVLVGEFSRELAGAAQTAIAAIQESSKKHKKKVSSSSIPNARVVSPSVQQQQQQHHQQQLQQQSSVAVSAVQAQSGVQNQIQAQLTSATSSITSSAVAAGTGTSAASTQAAQITDAENPDWTYDPNEPRYCICDQVSYGDMVACDNLDCPFEWFHYPCVNITSPPKGKWYCPQCTSSMKRRGGRKN